MSAPRAGKFQDHYALLGIDPKSDSDAIALAYAKWSEKYHPNNPETGDPEKFEKVNLAFEVLSDPLLRREFDNLKGVSLEVGTPKFSGLMFFDALGRGTGLRLALLCVLYDRRRTRPFTPSLSMRHVENILQSTEEELNFVMWYLKQRGLIGSDDKSSLQITVAGMDFLEKNHPAAELVMPFIKATGLASPPAQAPEANISKEAAAGLPALAAAVVEPAAAPAVMQQGEEPVAAVSPATPTVTPPVAPVAPRPHESVQNLMRRTRARV
jgi:curved DNA-binding protein